ncbi:PEP-CTERM sorting domain-containing protein [Rhodoferax sp.]|uniref:PEP-CTERM sorting domain-containing protein n=1 Tax=Rhodoferax sp. TaxID=50421 RepID=UPI002772934E|nr:PEP-CTERM sorting domain-containing protein [Rhodoferax sp.]
MSFKSSTLAAITVVAALFGPAQAAVVTFAPLTSASQGPAGDGTTYLESGLTFTSSVVSSSALYHWGTTQSFNADPTGATLFQNFPGQSLIVTQTGGGDFFLNSFDLADAYNTGAASVILFTYTDGTGTYSSNLTLDSLIGLQTFSFGMTVSSFSLRQDSPYFQIDNVVFNGGHVPEPTSLALLGLGLIALRLGKRK